MTWEIESYRCDSRYEPLDEWFFPCIVFEDGTNSPVPLEAFQKYTEFSDNWLLNHPKGVEIPTVRLFAVKDDTRMGYIVQIGVFYPPSSEIK